MVGLVGAGMRAQSVDTHSTPTCYLPHQLDAACYSLLLPAPDLTRPVWLLINSYHTHDHP